MAGWLDGSRRLCATLRVRPCGRGRHGRACSSERHHQQRRQRRRQHRARRWSVRRVRALIERCSSGTDDTRAGCSAYGLARASRPPSAQQTKQTHTATAHTSLSRVRSRASPAALARAYARHTSAPGVVAAGRGRRRCGVPRTWRRRRAEADNGGALVLAMRAAQRAESRAEEEDGWRRELARKPNMGLAARP